MRRARYPDETGYVERDGVRVFWERYGDGDPTVLLLPTWTIIHSRCWKAQIPYLGLFIRPPIAAGWLKFNAAHWLADYPDFVEWWMRRVFNTSHSTKQLEDAIGWALETDAKTLIASVLSDLAAPATRRDQLALARRVRCPVLVISAPNDKITAHADAKASLRQPAGNCCACPRAVTAPRRASRWALISRSARSRSAFTADSRTVRAPHTVR